MGLLDLFGGAQPTATPAGSGLLSGDPMALTNPQNLALMQMMNGGNPAVGRQNALLGIAQGLLQGSGASRLPVTTGAALGQGLANMHANQNDLYKNQYLQSQTGARNLETLMGIRQQQAMLALLQHQAAALSGQATNTLAPRTGLGGSPAATQAPAQQPDNFLLGGENNALPPALKMALATGGGNGQAPFTAAASSGSDPSAQAAPAQAVNAEATAANPDITPAALRVIGADGMMKSGGDLATALAAQAGNGAGAGMSGTGQMAPTAQGVGSIHNNAGGLFLPPGIGLSQLPLLAIANPGLYEKVMENNLPDYANSTNDVKNLMARGISPQSQLGQQMLEESFQHENQTLLRPGQQAINAQGTVTNWAPPVGYLRNAQGGLSIDPGYAAGEGQEAYAKSYGEGMGKLPSDIREFTDAAGNKFYISGQQIMNGVNHNVPIQAGIGPGVESGLQEQGKLPYTYKTYIGPDGRQYETTGDQAQSAMRSGQPFMTQLSPGEVQGQKSAAEAQNTPFELKNNQGQTVRYPAGVAGGPGSAITGGPTISDEAAQKGLADQGIARYNAIQDAAGKAQQTLATVQEMRGIIARGDLTTGPLTNLLTKLTGPLQQLGLDPSQYIPALKANPNSAAEINKLTTMMAFQMAKSLGSRVAAQEVQMAMKANPNINTPQGAFNAMMNFIGRGARYQVAKQAAMQDYLQSHNNNPQGFDAWFNQQYPIGKFFGRSINTDPNVFMKAYPSDAERAQAIQSMNPFDRQQLEKNLLALRKKH